MSEGTFSPENIASAAMLPAVLPPPVADGLDLTSCDREPIHMPGSIQPHGFLLALDDAGRVTIASGSAAHYLHRAQSTIFGISLAELLGNAIGSALLEGLEAEPLGSATRLLKSVTLPAADGGMQSFEVVAYQSQGKGGSATVLEFEVTKEQVDIGGINARLYNFVASIRRMQSTSEICQAAVDEITALTRCDRVVLYRFDDRGHGVVLAEVRAHEKFTSYLGLHFPASDVPAQARRMYELNRVRIIPNVDYEPSPLLTMDGGAPELDLSSSILRSVSPIHRQYMRNMGTVCSMSVSILIDGHLWGLVSCHHHEPRYVQFRLRAACDFVMQIVASQLEWQQAARQLQSALRAKALESRLLAALATESSCEEGLAASPDLLMELVAAKGVAIVTEGAVKVFGQAPSEPEVLRLAEWIRKHQAGVHLQQSFVSSSLFTEYEEARDFSAEASGVLSISLSRMHNTQVLWFRPEIVQSVRWAGDPQKPATAPPTPQAATDPASQLPQGIVHPRHSFDAWLQVVRGCCEPWAEQDIRTAEEFRDAVLKLILYRVEQLADLAAGLQVANEELEAFSYSVSHDLRAPFRHISGFSEMLKEEDSERMSERGRHYLATIMSSARFAGLLVDSLLDFSRFARAKITMHPVSMEDAVDSEWKAVLYDEAPERTIAFSRGALPHVMADPQLMRQVLRNLFSNAIKYTRRQPEARVRLEAAEENGEIIFSVADNGAGFDQQYAGKLFGVFQRLHRIEDFEGTGIGLANVRRIIGRHGGKVWAKGRVGEGATFYFSMPPIPLPEEA